MDEKRKNGRYIVDFQTELKSEQVFLYELIEDSITEKDPIHREGIATMLNISKNGCYIHCYEPFPPKTRLLITIIPVAFPNHKIFATGLIIRQKPDERYGYYYGIQFIAYDEGSETILDKFLDHLIVTESSRVNIPN